MTAFQALIVGFITAVSSLLPLPAEIANEILFFAAGWEVPAHHVHVFNAIIFAVIFLYWLRHEWLGLLTASFRLILRPHKPNNLDEQQVLFFAIIQIPLSFLFAFRPHFQWVWLPPVMGIMFAFFWKFVFNWGKQNKGANHIRFIDALGISALLTIAAIPGVGMPVAFLTLFLLFNYDFETSIRFTWIGIGIQTFVFAIQSMTNGSLEDAVSYFGTLPSIVLAGSILITGALIIDALKSMRKEQIKFRFFWLRLLGSIAALGLFFWKGIP